MELRLLLLYTLLCAPRCPVKSCLKRHPSRRRCWSLPSARTTPPSLPTAGPRRGRGAEATVKIGSKPVKKVSIGSSSPVVGFKSPPLRAPDASPQASEDGGESWEEGRLQQRRRSTHNGKGRSGCGAKKGPLKRAHLLRFVPALRSDKQENPIYKIELV